MGQMHLVKEGAVQKGERYCPTEKEGLESMDEVEGVQRFFHCLLHVKGYCRTRLCCLCYSV